MARLEARRGGFTVIELLLVLVLGLMILGGAYATLVKQEQAYAQVGAMAETGEATRTGIDFLAAELREISPGGGDLVIATADSLRIRALRKFGIVCETRKFNSTLVVAQFGIDPFEAEDSLIVYADGDSLRMEDDSWKPAFAKDATLGVCDPTSSTLALNLAGLLPSATVQAIGTQGAALKFDSVFPGAPIRSFKVLTYARRVRDGQLMLTMTDVTEGVHSPLVGPLTASGGLRFRYFDAAGTELTSFPLSAAARASVRRIRVELRSEQPVSSGSGTVGDVAVTDIYTRGS